MSSRISLVRVLSELSEEEARAIYEALSQWSDNERNGLEEDCPHTESERLQHDVREWEVSLVEGVVGKLDTEFVKLAEVTGTP